MHKTTGARRQTSGNKRQRNMVACRCHYGKTGDNDAPASLCVDDLGRAVDGPVGWRAAISQHVIRRL